MCVTKNQVTKIIDQSFDKWFNVWFEKSNLDRIIERAAEKGFHYCIINCNTVAASSDIEERWMKNCRFVGSLRNKYKGFTVERKQETKTALFGGSIEINEVVISWEELE